MLYFECSALNGENVDLVFEKVAKTVKQKIEDKILDLDAENPMLKIIDLKVTEEEKQEKAKYYCSSC